MVQRASNSLLWVLSVPVPSGGWCRGPRLMTAEESEQEWQHGTSRRREARPERFESIHQNGSPVHTNGAGTVAGSPQSGCVSAGDLTPAPVPSPAAASSPGGGRPPVFERFGSRPQSEPEGPRTPR